MVIRDILYKAGFGQKLEDYFTEDAFFDIAYDPLDHTAPEVGYILRSKGKIIALKRKYSILDAIEKLCDVNISDKIEIIAVRRLSTKECIYCISGNSEKGYDIVIAKGFPSGKIFFMKSSLSLFELNILDKDIGTIEENPKIAQTKTNFGEINEWYTKIISIQEETRKAQEKNNSVA
jgi:hypothetical protein